MLTVATAMFAAAAIFVALRCRMLQLVAEAAATAHGLLQQQSSLLQSFYVRDCFRFCLDE